MLIKHSSYVRNTAVLRVIVKFKVAVAPIIKSQSQILMTSIEGGKQAALRAGENSIITNVCELIIPAIGAKISLYT
mgnify:CR=1 FL=1